MYVSVHVCMYVYKSMWSDSKAVDDNTVFGRVATVLIEQEIHM